MDDPVVGILQSAPPRATDIQGMSLALLESNRLGEHRVLALYGDTTLLPTRTHGLQGLDARLDFDCCNNSGVAASVVLDVVGDMASPTAATVFHDRPYAMWVRCSISVSERGGGQGANHPTNSTNSTRPQTRVEIVVIAPPGVDQLNLLDSLDRLPFPSNPTNPANLESTQAGRAALARHRPISTKLGV